MTVVPLEVVPGFVEVEVGSSVWSGSCETLRQTVPRI
jgi:hypothetical protein